MAGVEMSESVEGLGGGLSLSFSCEFGWRDDGKKDESVENMYRSEKGERERNEVFKFCRPDPVHRGNTREFAS